MFGHRATDLERAFHRGFQIPLGRLHWGELHGERLARQWRKRRRPEPRVARVGRDRPVDRIAPDVGRQHLAGQIKDRDDMSVLTRVRDHDTVEVVST